MKKGLAILLAGLLALSMAGCQREIPAETMVLESEHYQVDAAMMSYFIYSEYTVFINDNADYLSLYGLDASLPLAEQESVLADGESWLCYFEEQATEQVKEYLLLAELAQDEGLALNEEDQDGIGIVLDAFYKAAEKEGHESEDYLEMSFGEGITEADVRRCLELSTLAQKYYKNYYAELSFTDEELEAFYKKNRDDYTFVDYYVYNVEADTKANAKARAEKIAEATDYKSFLAAVQADLEGLSAEAMEATLEKLFVKGNIYYEDKEYSKWLFSEAKVGETLVVEGDKERFSVYLCAKEPYRLENKTRNVRYIPLMAATYGSIEAADQQAMALLVQLHQKGLTEEAFAEVAAKYSEHISASQGGLIENAARSDFMEPIGNWMFSSKRTVGQCEIVPFDDQYGYAICQYLGEGIPEWKADCTAALKNERYQEDLSDWGETIKLTEHEWELELIPELKQN
ncbi:MAG: peptidylprolyl isomerase [Clostridia bacterium]|nr:peptidylprolyl isomerase [Clostridia bacterium]